MKIAEFSSDGHQVMIGTRWYTMTAAVQSFVGNAGIGVGEDVRFDVALNDESTVVKIMKKSFSGGGGGGYQRNGVSPRPAAQNRSPQPAAGSSATPSPAPVSRGWQPKSPEEQESIKKQAILHAVSRSLIGMQGHIDPNNVQEITEVLFNHYRKLVG